MEEDSRMGRGMSDGTEKRRDGEDGRNRCVVGERRIQGWGVGCMTGLGRRMIERMEG